MEEAYLDLLARLRALDVDVDGAIHRCADSPALYARFVERFPQDDSFGKLMIAVDRRAPDDEVFYAHTLAGVSGNLGLTRLYGVVSEMLALYRKGEPENARKLAGALSEAHRALAKCILEGA